MVPYAVNVRAREKIIYCIVINKDVETYLFYINNVNKLLNEEEALYKIIYVV